MCLWLLWLFQRLQARKALLGRTRLRMDPPRHPCAESALPMPGGAPRRQHTPDRVARKRVERLFATAVVAIKHT